MDTAGSERDDDACVQAGFSAMYTCLEAFKAVHGPPDMLLKLKDGPALPVHSLVVKSLSNVLGQVPTTETETACEVVPLEGDETTSWVQAIISMYMSINGASEDDIITALLVSGTNDCSIDFAQQLC